MLFLKEHDCTFPPKTTHLPRRAGGVKEDNTPPPKSGVERKTTHAPQKRGEKERDCKEGALPVDHKSVNRAPCALPCKASPQKERGLRPRMPF